MNIVTNMKTFYLIALVTLRFVFEMIRMTNGKKYFENYDSSTLFSDSLEINER